MLEHILDMLLPPIISILEFIGVVIVTTGAFRAFYHYIVNALRKGNYNYKYVLFNAMTTGLEFKMAAEILKTVIIRDFYELVSLGAVILLRALMSFLIRAEMRADIDKHEAKLEHGRSEPSLEVDDD